MEIDSNVLLTVCVFHGCSFNCFISCFAIIGACLDFKLQVTVPLEDFGPWEERYDFLVQRYDSLD